MLTGRSSVSFCDTLGDIFLATAMATLSPVDFNWTSADKLRSKGCLGNGESLVPMFRVTEERLNSFSGSSLGDSSFLIWMEVSGDIVSTPRGSCRRCQGESGWRRRGNIGVAITVSFVSSLLNFPVNLSSASWTASSRLGSNVFESRLRKWLRSMPSRTRLPLALEGFIGERDLARSTRCQLTKKPPTIGNEWDVPALRSCLACRPAKISFSSCRVRSSSSLSRCAPSCLTRARKSLTPSSVSIPCLL